MHLSRSMLTSNLGDKLSGVIIYLQLRFFLRVSVGILDFGVKLPFNVALH